MDLSRIITFKYYFTRFPDHDFRFAELFFVLGILLILVGAGFQYYRKTRLKDAIVKKMTRRISAFFKWFGVVMLLLTGIRIAGIPYLAMRAWWVVYFALFFYYAVTRLLRFRVEYRQRRERLKHNRQKGKYLPGKKK